MLCLKGKIHRKILVSLKLKNINYKITTNFTLSLKDKIQGFMLCLKGKIPRKINDRSIMFRVYSEVSIK
jgi:hypothetical protein